MHFSLIQGRPIALMCYDKRLNRSRKKKKKEILYLSENNDESIKLTIELIKERDIRNNIEEKTYDQLITALKTGIHPINPIAKRLYADSLDIIRSKMKQEFIKPECIFSPIPLQITRECIYACGPSGSGKSCYVANYAMNYLKLFPENRVYLLSRLDKDKSIDQIPNLLRIVVTPDIVNYEIKHNEFENSLVIFDDIDTIPNAKVKAFIENLLDDLLQTGRHANTYVAATTHLLYNGKKSRMLLNEIHCATIFPGRSTRHSINYLCEKYFGLTRKQVSEICQLPSRWITLYKSPPMVLYEKGAKFLC